MELSNTTSNRLMSHDMTLTRNNIVDYTKITRGESDIIRLQIAEAVIILSDDPQINRQDTGKTRTLKLFSWLYWQNIMCKYLCSNLLLIVIMFQYSGYSC